MKKATLLLLIVSILLFSACKKSSQPQAVVYSMSYKVDGAAVTINSPTAVLLASNDSQFGKLLSLTTPDTSNFLVFRIANAQVGTFVINGSPFANAALVVNSTLYNGRQGTFAITVLTDDTVAGTFQFIVANQITGAQKNITEGKFTCKLYHSP